MACWNRESKEEDENSVESKDEVLRYFNHGSIETFNASTG